MTGGTQLLPSVSSPSAAIDAGATRALALSRFAQRALHAELGHAATAERMLARLVELGAEAWSRTRMEALLDAGLAPDAAATIEAEPLGAALRRLRRQVLLGLMVRDIAGVAPLAEVVGAVTALAELAVQRALPVAARELARRFGLPCDAGGIAQDLLVVAMGKGGGGELNVSSDLDLIFVYDEEGETVARDAFGDATSHLTNQEFFERLGRRLIALIAEPTGDGFVFRVDMRLRPNGDAGPLAVSTSMLEEYLIRQGREWERFAWLKGRVISAPVFASAQEFTAQRAALDAVVQPFVFRKYLDFNAITALRDLHALIRAETQKKSARRAGGRDDHDVNIKLGRGGIREIEFIAQTYQIMRGGRDARLRQRATLVTLARLGELGIIAVQTCQQLAAHYVFLRRLEHALQYVDDAQTHLVPDDAAARAGVAQMVGLHSGDELMEQLGQVREFVARTFDSIFLAPEMTAAAEDLPTEAELTPERLRNAGFAQPEESAQRIAGLMAARRVASAREAARTAIQRLIVRGVDAIGRMTTDIPRDDVLARLARLIEAIAGRSTYLALLNQYPRAFERVLRVLAASRWAADFLTQHPILLDELLDERLTALTNDTPVDFSDWRADLAAHLDALGDDVEHQMNLVRDEHHAQLFRLLVADLDGRLTVERLADHLSLLADGVLDVVLERVWRSLPRRHGDAMHFAVVGYGKYGGKELGYVSDLDLVFVYDDPHPEAELTYITLARRLLLWLSTQTSSGTLFDVDLRLRPDGEKGLLVSPFAALQRYQRNEDGHGAWVWEHQALTRARFCAGDAALGQRFEQLRAEVLARPRDRALLAAEVLKMRKRMHDGHPNRSALFDLKHDEGGMVDVEFIVQFLVLAHAHMQARLLGNLGNIALLRIAGELGLIDATLATAVGDAYREYRRRQHRLRLNGAEFARVPADEVR
ncbi:MAG: bifunctional [glutamate--ammonia ligase]-adenylyl-L-tyrosine phosphorylase/[glutamate--ammonia-ligase] adenylyltransferase, partial [Gemmatimonadota bacterium]